jgi:hypothetical protein
MSFLFLSLSLYFLLSTSNLPIYLIHDAVSIPIMVQIVMRDVGGGEKLWWQAGGIQGMEVREEGRDGGGGENL